MACGPFLSRGVLLFLGTVALGLVVKYTLFDLENDRGDGAVLVIVVSIMLAALFLTAGLRAPHPYRDGSIPDPSTPPSRLPRWRRPPDRMPLGAWIAIPVLMAWGGLGFVLILAMLSSLLGRWPVLAGIGFFLGLYHWRKSRRRRTRGMAPLPIGAIILVPVLVIASVTCLGVLIAGIVAAFTE